jgi:mannosyl-3-phosphoglycerate phosphatase
MYLFPAETHPGLIVFTDLDGTLLDHHNYSWAAAQPALERLRKKAVAVILTTSKTLAESKELARELHNIYPCIVENGGGIAWPSIDLKSGYEMEALGSDRRDLLKVLEPLHQSYDFRSCKQMDVTEFVALTGLDEDSAARAMQRHFSEPLIWRDTTLRLDEFVAEVAAQGMSVLRGGRFLHLMGGADKGKAMEKVMECWAQQRTGYTSVVLGDSQNDVAMLERADIGVAVKSPNQGFPNFSPRGERLETDLLGPAGWNKTMLMLLQRLHIN